MFGGGGGGGGGGGLFGANPPQLTPERQRQPTHSELLRVEVAQRMRLVGLEGVVDSDSQHSLLLPQLVIRLVVHLSQRWELRVTNLEEQLPVRIPHLHLQQLPYKHLDYRSAVTLERPDSEDSLVLQKLQKPTRSQLLLQVVSASEDRMQTPPLVPQREARLLLRRQAIPSDQPRLQEALGFSDNQRRKSATTGSTGFGQPSIGGGLFGAKTTGNSTPGNRLV